jgi:outer membrane lipoprotein-sorting protein
MKAKKLITGLLLAMTAMSLAQAQENELKWTMDSAIKQLDRQGSDLETVLAQVEIEWSGEAQGLDRIKTGRIYFNSKGDFRIAGETPNKKTLLVEGRTLHMYDPAASQVTEVNLSRDKSRLEPYMRLGFSITGRDLEDDFLITFAGESEIGDRRTLTLELTPKRDEVRAIVAKIAIAFDQASWLPARQIVSHTSGTQTLTVNYSGTARNLNLNPELFRDKWPRGTDKVRE